MPLHKWVLVGLIVCLATGLVACETTKPATRSAGQTSQVAPPTNTKCPVSGDDVKPGDPKLPTVVYNGKTYTCCCPDCVKDFNANPRKYIKTE